MKNQDYPYRIASNGWNQNNYDQIIYQHKNQIQHLRNEVDHIEKEINTIRKNTDGYHDNEKLYQQIIHYINKNCDCNNNVDTRERILTGNGTPSDNLGENGSFYLDNDNGNYYIKIAGRWIPRGNLRGPTGLPGSHILTGRGRPSDALGNIGDFYLDNISKRYYVKVGSTDSTGVWVQQGTLSSNKPNNLVMPLNFGAKPLVPSTSGSDPESVALVADGITTNVPYNGKIELSTDSYYKFIYRANTTVQLSNLNVTITNLINIADQKIHVQVYYAAPNTSDFLPTGMDVIFSYDNTPAFTNMTDTSTSIITLTVGSSIIIGVYGVEGQGTTYIPCNVFVELS